MFTSIFNALIAPHNAMDENGNHPNRGFLYNAIKSPTTRVTGALFAVFMLAAGPDNSLENVRRNLAVGFGSLAIMGFAGRTRTRMFNQLTKQPRIYFDPHPQAGETSHGVPLRQFKQSFGNKTLAWSLQNAMGGIVLACVLPPASAALVVSYVPAQILTDAVVRAARSRRVASGEWIVTNHAPPPNYP